MGEGQNSDSIVCIVWDTIFLQSQARILLTFQIVFQWKMGKSKKRSNWRKWGKSLYRANPNYLRNPKFCVGCFEFYFSKILRQHLQQGKKYFAIFFCGTHFCGAY